jgi:oxygen-independent coproporphyrinogen-3 oxidase
MSQQSASISVDLLKKYDRPGPRYTSYPTVPTWSNEIGSAGYTESLRRASEQAAAPLAVYLHIPFCRKRCYYCGCNTCVVQGRDTIESYLKSLKSEIEETSALLAPRSSVSQVHFGGGTPTYLTVEEMTGVLDALGAAFSYRPGCEMSIEVDPRVTSDEQLGFLREKGFSRISFGVQDLDPGVQEAIGRIQPAELVRQKLGRCRELGFDGINFDLIYGLPRQTIEKFSKTVDEVIDMRPDRIALYSFAFLPQLKSHQTKLPQDELPDLATKFGLFAIALERLTASGYSQIGMDHFALPDDELSKALADGRLHRNFMGYTVQTTTDMLGLGMSSIGYIDNCFYQNVSSVGDYIAAVDGGKLATYRGLQLDQNDLVRKFVIESLMCNFTVSFEDLSRRFGVQYGDYFAEEHPRLKEFVDDGLLTCSDNGLEVTAAGRTFVRNIAMTFDSYLPKDQSGEGPRFSRTI